MIEHEGRSEHVERTERSGLNQKWNDSGQGDTTVGLLVRLTQTQRKWTQCSEEKKSEKMNEKCIMGEKWENQKRIL